MRATTSALDRGLIGDELTAAVYGTGLESRWDRVLADAAFDSEAHHRCCRGRLKVPATVIPLNGRGRGRN